MADVKIRNLDDQLYQAYRGMAEEAGISLEEQFRRVLTEYVQLEREAAVKRIEAGLKQMRAKYGVMEESWPGIREDRDERG